MANDRNVVEIVLKAIDQASKPIKDLNDKLQKTFDPFKQVANKADSLGKALGLKQVEKSWNGVTKSVGAFKDTVVSIVAPLVTVATVAGGALAFLGRQSAESANSLLQLSAATGMSVESIQRLRYFAEQNQSTTEDLDSAIKKFTVNMGQARAGQGALYSILAKVNPEMLRQLLHTKDNEQAFNLMLEAIRKLPKAQQQAALTSIAFGKGSLSLVSVAKAGREEYEKSSAELAKLGPITAVQATLLNKMGDAWGSLGTLLGNLRNQVFVELAPIFIELAGSLKTFLIDNKDAIIQFGKALAESLPGILKVIAQGFKILIALGTILGNIFSFITEHTTLLNLVLATIAAIVAGKLIIAIYGVTTAVYALGVALLATPIGWILAALAALVALTIIIASNWDVVVGIWKEAVDVFEHWIELIAKGLGYLASIPEKITTSLGITSEPLNVTGDGRAPVSKTQNQSTVKVSFDNLPKGARVTNETTAADYLDLQMGYAMQ